MGRPRTINADGAVKHLTVRVSAPVAQQVEDRAKAHGVTVSSLLRQWIEAHTR